LAGEELAWAVRRDNPALLTAVNSTLAAWKKDGTLQGLIKKWLPQ
jgi:ABC-type amino acid transport substrate-binding protein